MAPEPYFAEAAPWTTSIWSKFSAPRRINSSPCPAYLANSPIAGCPSIKINVWRGSAPRMDTPTRPIASTVRDTPVSWNTTSSTFLACFASMSFCVMIVVCCVSYCSAAFNRSASTYTAFSAATPWNKPIHVIIAPYNSRCLPVFL